MTTDPIVLRNKVRTRAHDRLNGLDLLGVMAALDAEGLNYKLRVETASGRIYRGTVWDARLDNDGYGKFNTRAGPREALAGAYARYVMEAICGRIDAPRDEGEVIPHE